MPAKNWPLFFNEFWRDYLSTADSIAAGVPASDTLRRLLEQDRESVTRPYLLIRHERRPETLRNVYDARMILTLYTLEDDTTGTSAEDAETYLSAIRDRIADVTAVRAYIATLPTTNATDDGRGWMPAVLHVVATPWEIERGEKEGHASRTFDFTWTCIVEQP